MSKIDPKEKLKRIALRDRLWAEVRDEKQFLVDLLAGKDITDKDVYLIFKIFILVANEIEIYEEEFSDIDQKMKDIINDRTAAGHILRIFAEAKCFQKIQNKQLPEFSRQDSIETVRKSIWNNIANYRIELLQILNVYPLLLEDQIFLILECIQTVLIELELQAKELEIIENSL